MAFELVDPAPGYAHSFDKWSLDELFEFHKRCLAEREALRLSLENVEYSIEASRKSLARRGVNCG